MKVAKSATGIRVSCEVRQYPVQNTLYSYSVLYLLSTVSWEEEEGVVYIYLMSLI